MFIDLVSSIPTVIDIITPSFNSTSFLEYPGLFSSTLTSTISLVFNPATPHALLLYYGNVTNNRDFISLSLVDQRVGFEMKEEIVQWKSATNIIIATISTLTSVIQAQKGISYSKLNNLLPCKALQNPNCLSAFIYPTKSLKFSGLQLFPSSQFPI